MRKKEQIGSVTFPPQIYRTFLLVAGVIYPAWSVLIMFFLPGTVDDLTGRLVISFLCFVLVFSSRVSKSIESRLSTLTCLLFSGITLHYYSVLYISEFENLYLVCVFLVLLCVAQGIQGVKEYLFFSCLSLIGAAFVAYFSDVPLVTKVIFLPGVITAHFVQFLTQYLKFKAERKIKSLAFEKARLQQLGTIAIRLGDRINNPLQMLWFLSEELEEEGSEEAKKNAQSIRSYIVQIGDEVAKFSAFKQYAQDGKVGDELLEKGMGSVD